VSALLERPLPSASVDTIAHILVVQRLHSLGITVTHDPMPTYDLCRWDEPRRVVTLRDTAALEHQLWALTDLYCALADPDGHECAGIPDPQLRLVPQLQPT
jgi:hypothetical protein